MANPNPKIDHLTPFEKGQSGNPKGGSAKRTMEKVFNDFLLETAKSKDGTEKQRLRAILEGQWLAAVKGSTPAANFFVERVAGKPDEHHSLSGNLSLDDNRKAVAERIIQRLTKGK
jgi:hypothetical protein